MTKLGSLVAPFRFLFSGALIAILLGSGCSTSPPAPPVAPTTAGTLEQLYGDLTRARTATEFYVRSVRRKLPATSENLFEAERLYEEARGSVNGWLADLQSMVRNGTMLSDQVLEVRRQNASNAVVEFNTYADQLIHPPGSTNGDAATKELKFIPALTVDAVVGLGRTLYDEINRRRLANREAYTQWAQAEGARLEKAHWSAFNEVK